MKAAVFIEPGRIEVRDVPLAPCGPDDIIVKIHACGICGSDVRNFRAGLRRNAQGITSQIMGHEFTGVVSETGANVTRYRIGDPVAAAPDVSCGRCWYCRRGLANLCDYHRMLGVDWPGGFAEYAQLPAEVLERGMIHHVPDGLSLDDAAMSEPAASVIAAQENAGVGLGDTILILGDGPIGCLHLEVARARGASRVFMSGALRLRAAEAFGPDLLMDGRREDVVRKVREATGGLGVDFAVCANPVAATQEQGVQAVRKRGTVILFGGLPKDKPRTTLDSNRIHYGEIRVVGAFSYPAPIHLKALAAIRDGVITPSKYITLILPLDETVRGFAAAVAGEALKVLIKP
ncbi:MAG: alcohol dehydrogenase catalytic domain-containing protein [Planctomycetota bacterium]|jgi:L-iditol 2-dehydrogenase|nr:alcohol dehydrogenase catalytic domain-containing protein [Planctomycetota bacterium]